MNKIANGLDARPSAADGAEVRPREIGEKVGLAISAWPKEWQRLGRQIRRRDEFGGQVGLILPTVAAKDAAKSQRHGSSGRRQASHNVSAAIDKAIGRDRRRQFELCLLGDAMATIGVDIHHGENCRRLCKLERNIETVPNLHIEYPRREPAHQTAGTAKRLNSGLCSVGSTPRRGRQLIPHRLRV